MRVAARPFLSRKIANRGVKIIVAKGIKLVTFEPL